MSDSAALEGFPLSHQQRRIWLLQSERGELCAQGALRLTDVDVGRLRDALSLVVERHEILRTTFRRGPGMRLPFQVVVDPLEPEWREVSGAALDVDELLARERERPFDWEAGSLLRATLVTGNQERLLLLTLPAMCADRHSLLRLGEEIAAAYTRQVPSPDEPLQYADVAGWQEELLAGDDPEARQGRTYRHRTLEQRYGDGERRMSSGRFRPWAGRARLRPETVERVEDLGARLGGSASDLLLAAWAALQWKLRREPWVSLGAVLPGRKLADLDAVLGPLARVSPLRVPLSGRVSFAETVEQVAEALRVACEWQEYALWDDPVAPALPIGFEEDAGASTVSVGGERFVWLRRHGDGETFREKLVVRHEAGGPLLELRMDAAIHPPEEAAAQLERYLRVVEQTSRVPDAPLSRVDLLDDAERRRLVVDFNRATLGPAEPPLFHQCVAEQVAVRPAAPAVIAGGECLSYGELDRRANLLARHLRRLGVRLEDRVALCLGRTTALPVALLAAVKAGAAYVPLDPVNPDRRIRQMLEDSEAVAVVTEAALAARFQDFGGPVVVVDRDCAAIERERADDPGVHVAPENLLYVVFTSGTTGRPKGVAVEHRHMASYVAAILDRLDMPPGASWATISSFAADLGNTMIFPALAKGDLLHVLPSELVTDPVGLSDYLKRHRVDALKIVPSHLGALLAGGDREVLPHRRLVLGGAAPSPDLVSRLFRSGRDELAILNHYGPSEATVGVLAGSLEDDGAPPSLGRPLAGSRVYLLDPDLQPVPSPVTGELWIGGGTVARGYLGAPAETAERFLPDPLAPVRGARAYRTGDLARFLAPDRLVFAGRADHQVKIRGFRVEPDEVEAALRRQPGVGEAAVICRTGSGDEAQLAAYAVPAAGEAVDSAGLLAQLRQELPDYMVPASCTLLDELPLTSNGKLDRAALSEREPAGRGSSRKPVPPRNDTERTLLDIWRQALESESIGVEDNFFELGGDSILAIQIIARAGRAGLRVDLQQIFEHQTVAALAAVAEGLAEQDVAEQGPVTGRVPLTPIQRRFFAMDLAEPGYWNQSVLLKVPDSLPPMRCSAALQHLLRHHDALRLTFKRDDEEWRQELTEPDLFLPLECFDLSRLGQAGRKQALPAIASRLHRTIRLTEPPLVRAGWIDLGEAGRRLLLIAHHLLVDAVSWRVLIEDLQGVINRLGQGGSVELPPKTTSFKRWADRLAELSSGELPEESSYWLSKSLEGVVSLPRDRVGSPEVVGSVRLVNATLDAEKTRRLQEEASSAYRATFYELLLACVGRVLGRWTGADRVWVDLEGHGREPLFREVDVSRTVGWFTSRFPMAVDAGSAMPLDEHVATVREAFRAIPSRGVGFGLLRWSSPDLQLREAMARLPCPEVSFNYLGSYGDTESGVLIGPQDGSGGESGAVRLRPAGEYRGPDQSPLNRHPYRLGISAWIANGRLRVEWSYDRDGFAASTVRSLSTQLVGELQELVETAPEVGDRLRPEDFELAGMDEAKLERLAELLDDG